MNASRPACSERAALARSPSAMSARALIVAAVTSGAITRKLTVDETVTSAVEIFCE